MAFMAVVLVILQTDVPRTKATFDAEVQFLLDWNWKGDFAPGWVSGLHEKHSKEMFKAAGLHPMSFPSTGLSRPREADREPVWISLQQNLFKNVPRPGGYQSIETNLDNWDQYENERIRHNVLSTTLLQFDFDPNWEARVTERESWIEKMPYQSHNESKREYQGYRLRVAPTPASPTPLSPLLR